MKRLLTALAETVLLVIACVIIANLLKDNDFAQEYYKAGSLTIADWFHENREFMSLDKIGFTVPTEGFLGKIFSTEVKPFTYLAMNTLPVGGMFAGLASLILGVGLFPCISRRFLGWNTGIMENLDTSSHWDYSLGVEMPNDPGSCLMGMICLFAIIIVLGLNMFIGAFMPVFIILNIIIGVIQLIVKLITAIITSRTAKDPN